MTQQKLYKGFGEDHTLAEWARLLGIRLGVLTYCVEKEKKTIDEVAGFLGIVYPRPKKRKPREGAHMAEGRKLVEELLKRSGYEVEPGSVVLRLIRNTSHKVTFNGKHLAKYDYKTGYLSNLFEGHTMPLRASFSDQLTIQQNQYGYWELTPGSRAIISRDVMKKIESNELPDFGEKYEEIELLAGSKNSVAKNSVLYEHKGRKATCAEWARRLDLPRNTLWRYLQKGLSIEEIIQKRGIE